MNITELRCRMKNENSKMKYEEECKIKNEKCSKECWRNAIEKIKNADEDWRMRNYNLGMKV